MLLRKQTKQSKSDEEGSDEGPVKSPPSTSSQGRSEKSTKQSSKTGEPVPKKKRRGRPPGITGASRKPNQGYKIHNHAAAAAKKNSSIQGGKPGQTAEKEDDKTQEEEDIMAGISPEKALQYNIVLQDINRKIMKATWTSD